jgi:hypothetical protein
VIRFEDIRRIIEMCARVSSILKLKREFGMKKLFVITVLLFVTGCASMHSPYDLYEWCVYAGSPRLTSIGPEAQDPRNCSDELDEDLADRTPRILYVPRDVVMSPVIAARGLWGFLALTRPPF